MGHKLMAGVVGVGDGRWRRRRALDAYSAAAWYVSSVGAGAPLALAMSAAKEIAECSASAWVSNGVGVRAAAPAAAAAAGFFASLIPESEFARAERWTLLGLATH